jgi:hypothetical protein
MPMKRTAIFILFFIGSLTTRAQVNTDSCTLEISLLTCTPGADLYSIFGHTAIRVRDPRRGMDIVYNYGTFDDTDPLFYVHFMRGIMNYSISVTTFTDFMMEYQFEHRSVVAQILMLNGTEKNKLYESLRINTLEENRLYPYHFHTDNCTTRAARMIETNTGNTLAYQNILPDPGPSYRDMIHEYLDRQHQYWPEFGIDMLLGKNLDIKPTNVEAIHFLPDYLYRGMDSAHLNNKPVVSEIQKLINFPPVKMSSFGLTPMALFECIFLMTIILFIFRTYPSITKTLFVIDIIFFSLLGLIGILMAFMWIGRIDNVCSNNINILWALPTHIIAVFFIRKKAVWVKYYFLMTAMLAAILLIGFHWWSQSINLAVIPILITIMFRGFILSKNRNHAEKNIIPGGTTGI